MTLDDWLKQDRSLGDQLKVMEGLCSALNDGHQAGSLHRGLEPANIEVASDGSCDLSGALSATGGASRYRAPEVAEGAAHSPQSDIYSAGVIFYEMLSGRSPSPDRPSPLTDLRPDIQRDLTDAVMGCLEKGPDWRPKDLSYLLQVVRTLRGQSAGKSVRSVVRTSDSPRSPAAKAPARRTGKTSASTSNVPLFVAAALLLVGAGVGGWFWLQGSKAPTQTAAVRPPAPTVPPTTLSTSVPSPEAVAPSAPAAAATPTARPTSEAVAPVPEATPTPRPTPTPTPPPTLAERPTPPPAPTPEAVVAPAPTPTPAAPSPEEMVAAGPAVLTAVSPLQVKRGATSILDVRGSGLRADQKATVLKIKEAPSGIMVVRQKFVNDGLLQVIVKLEETAAPGTYGLALSDANGTLSNTLPFTVAK